MKMMVCAVLACAAAVCTVAAQDRGPVSTALRADAERYEKNIVGAARIMPADKFATKPTPGQMSFAELVRHVAMGNDMICSWISGQPAPQTGELSASAWKDTLVNALEQSFAGCHMYSI